MQRTYRIPMAVLAVATALLVLGALNGAHAATTTWNGTADWTTANWDNGVPQAGDDAVIAGGTCTLSGDTASLNSVTVQSGATLLFDNWDTTLTATTVTVDGGGTITHAVCNGADTNRVRIVCTDLTVDASGSISASGKGYRGVWQNTGQGPGGGEGDGINRAGAGGHGGLGGNGVIDPSSASFNAGGRTYGSRNEPNMPGSGGGGVSGAAATGGAGGGVVRVEASGTVTVNGGVYATGYNAPLMHTDAGGSGGSIFIYCNTFAGAGAISANGGSSGNYGGGGGGGRIAIWCVTDSWSGAISASKGGNTAGQPEGFDGTVVVGTLSSYGDAVPASPNEWSGYEYYITGDTGNRDWASGINWSHWHSPAAGQDVLVYRHGSDAAVMYSSPPDLGSISVSNATVWFVNWDTKLTADAVTVQNSGLISHGSCNSAQSSSSRVCVVCTTIAVRSGGSINVSLRGYRGGGWSGVENQDGQGEGYGTGAFPGGGGGYGGAGYGGGGAVYGSATNAFGPGSGGGGVIGSAGIRGGHGGGAVRIIADELVTVDGAITASGETSPGGHTAGAGSGGAIYIHTPTFAGGGSLTAQGGGSGISSSGGAGGGGRIAVWSTYSDQWTGTHSVAGGADRGGGGGPGGDGTAEFLYLPPPPSGTVVIMR